MGKNQSASNLTNIIKQDASGSIAFMHGNTMLMSISSSGTIETTGNVAGTASYASNAELLDGLDSTVFTLTSSFAAQTASFTAFTSSVNTFTSSLNSFSASILTFTASQNILNGTYSTTGSNTFTGIQTVNSNLIVTGSITAQTLVVQTVTSSVVYSSGSNVFGNDIANTQTFTGSVNITGSTNLVGSLTVNKVAINSGNLTLANFPSLDLIVSGGIGFSSGGSGAAALVNRDGSGNTTFYGGSGDIKFTDVTMTSNYLIIKNAGNVGIGTASPTGTYGKLTVAGGIQITNDNNAKLEIGRYSSEVANSYIKIGSGSDSLRITNAADSADLFTISGSGNVGINTTSPANLLHLAGASATPSLRLGSISTGFHWDIGRENATTGDFVFNNANGGSTSERVRITTGGNVGIGTASITTYSLAGKHMEMFGGNDYSFFHNNTTTVKSFYAINEAALTAALYTFSNHPLGFGTNNTERMRITSGGTVLIGDTSNASGTPTFYVKNKAGAVANIAGWNFGGTTTAENGNNCLLTVGAYYNGSSLIATQTTATNYQQYSGTHVWYTNSGLTAGNSFSNTERMRINSGGGVRIGNPTAFNDDIRFNVYGTGVWAGANIGLQNGGTGGKDWIIFSTMNDFGQGGGNLLFYNNSGPTSNALIIYANGNYIFGGSNVSDLSLIHI